MWTLFVMGIAEAFLSRTCSFRFRWDDAKVQIDTEDQQYRLKVIGKQSSSFKVICIHGHLACFNDFDEIAISLKDTGAAVYSLDLDGEPSAFDTAVLVNQADYLTTVIDGLCRGSNSNCHLVAHSTGALVALEAMRHFAKSTIKSIHLMNGALESHPAPIDPSWGIYYFQLHHYLKTSLTTPVWSWSGGVNDFVVPFGLTDSQDITKFQHFSSSALPGVYSTFGHIELMFAKNFLLHAFLPALINGTIPNVPLTFEVRTVPGKTPPQAAVVTGCSGIGPVRLEVGADCPSEFAEMIGVGTGHSVYFEFSASEWSRVDLRNFQISGNSFSAGLLKLKKVPISISIPVNVTVSLKTQGELKIKKIPLPSWAAEAVVHAGEGVVATDGSAARKEDLLLPTNLGYFWSIGDSSVDVHAIPNLQYLAVRYWPTLLGYVIAVLVGGGSLIAVGLQVLTVVLLSQSLGHFFLFFLALLLSLPVSWVIGRIPRWFKLSLGWNLLVCLSYPQIGLCFIALQFGSKRERVLVAMLAVLKVLSLLSLVAAVYHVFAGDLKAGLSAVLVPGSSWESSLLCILPLFALYRPKTYSGDDIVYKLQAIIVGCVCTALISSGYDVYWQALTIQAALMPLKVKRLIQSSWNALLDRIKT